MGQNNIKKPRFFCQFCDSEVEQFSRQCKNCGRFFTSVNCANCGFVGESNLFSAGCPICGYAGTSLDPKKTEKHKDSHFSKSKKQKKSKKINNDPLPIWTLIIPSLLLVLILFLLFLRI